MKSDNFWIKKSAFIALEFSMIDWTGAINMSIIYYPKTL